MTVITLAGEREVKPISEIHPYSHNNKVHTPERIDQMIDAISSGYDQPITVDPHGVIIKGHRRYFAIKKMGATKVEVLVRKDLDPEAVRLARIVDNTIVNNEWSLDSLMTEIQDLNETGTIGSLLELGLNEDDAIGMFGQEVTDELLDLLSEESESEADEMLSQLNTDRELSNEDSKASTPAEDLVDATDPEKFDVPVGDDEDQIPDEIVNSEDDYTTVKPLTLNMTIHERGLFLSSIAKAKEVLNTSTLVETVLTSLSQVIDED